jgi:hypothetical protein
MVMKLPPPAKAFWAPAKRPAPSNKASIAGSEKFNAAPMMAGAVPANAPDWQQKSRVSPLSRLGVATHSR